MPGIIPNNPTIPEVSHHAFGNAASWLMTWLPTSCPVETRLTITPAAEEITSAGI
jgi:hypothetical protein